MQHHVALDGQSAFKFDPVSASNFLMTNFKSAVAPHHFRTPPADDGVFVTTGAEVRAPAQFATVEQFLIRGLGTACQVCVVGQPRSDSRRSASPLPKLLEDSPDRHQRPGRCLRYCSASQEAARGAVTWAIAQMNPTSSRAMAVMTTGAFFRRASIR